MVQHAVGEIHPISETCCAYHLRSLSLSLSLIPSILFVSHPYVGTHTTNQPTHTSRQDPTYLPIRSLSIEHRFGGPTHISLSHTRYLLSLSLSFASFSSISHTVSSLPPDLLFHSVPVELLLAFVRPISRGCEPRCVLLNRLFSAACGALKLAFELDLADSILHVDNVVVNVVDDVDVFETKNPVRFVCDANANSVQTILNSFVWPSSC